MAWCKSFLQNRMVRLCFNGRTSDAFELAIGMPQGSPVSLVLSIIYKVPLLYKIRSWSNASLGMYIDDGAIFACGKEWTNIEESMRYGYSMCINWLTRAGLNIEPDKTELMFFRKPRECTEPPPYIHLPLPMQSMYYQVQRLTMIQYLGFFFDACLNWMQHVEIMCNRTRVTLKALQLLGNSIHGFDHAQWRLAYNAICLPVLTYGCQLWFTGKQKVLVKKLQMVQNEVVRIMTGMFCTMPQDPLHQLMTIYPMKIRLNLLVQNTALCLYRALRGSQLLKQLGQEWLPLEHDQTRLPTPNDISANTMLQKLALWIPVDSLCIKLFPLIPKDASTWNGQVQTTPKWPDWDYWEVSMTLTWLCKEGSSINIYCEGTILNKDHEDGAQLGALAVVIYQGGKEKGHTEQVLRWMVTESDTQL